MDDKEQGPPPVDAAEDDDDDDSGRGMIKVEILIYLVMTRFLR